MTGPGTPSAGSPPSGRARLPEENKVYLVGRLTRDPDFRVTQNGRSLCRFDLAVNRRYQNKNTGEWTEETTFVPVIAWGPVAESCKENVKKGSPVRIEGRLHGNEFTDKTGAKRKVLEIYTFKVEFLKPPQAASKAAGTVSEGAPAAETDEDLEEVPF
jgi:single-strand DNA-binding protein